jgi:hypothetical protein
MFVSNGSIFKLKISHKSRPNSIMRKILLHSHWVGALRGTSRQKIPSQTSLSCEDVLSDTTYPATQPILHHRYIWTKNLTYNNSRAIERSRRLIILLRLLLFLPSTSQLPDNLTFSFEIINLVELFTMVRFTSIAVCALLATVGKLISS